MHQDLCPANNASARHIPYTIVQAGFAQPACSDLSTIFLCLYQESRATRPTYDYDYWAVAQISGGFGTNSVRWNTIWGAESLIKGENLICTAALEADGATVNNLGLGTPFVGNVTIYPLYYVGPPSTDVKAQDAAAPGDFALLQNYPNPFNAATTIEFILAQDSRVSLKVYDVPGREVTLLADGEMKAGVLHRVVFDGSKLASGIYFCRLAAGKHVQVKKLMLAR